MRFLSWLVGLALLALLAFFCVNRNAPRIEAELTADAQAALTAAGLDPAFVTLDGRDACLPTIPDAELLVELGKRVKNTRNYMKLFKNKRSGFDPQEEIFNYSVLKEYSGEPEPRQIGDLGWLDKSQPLRTDLESVAKGQKEMPVKVEFVDVFVDQ